MLLLNVKNNLNEFERIFVMHFQAKSVTDIYWLDSKKAFEKMNE